MQLLRMDSSIDPSATQCDSQPQAIFGLRPTRWVSQHAGLLLAIVVAIGITSRLAQYLSRQSYWHDEALLVMNLLDKNAGQLMTEHLDYEQAAPPLFLVLERASLKLGTTEYALRLLPLLCGIFSIVLMALLCRSLLPPSAAIVACGLLAYSDKLIWHAAEVKQYSGDVLATVLLFYLALVPSRPKSAALRLLLVSSAAAVLLWLSFITVFVFAGISLALLPTAARGGLQQKLRYIAINLPAAISFAFLYWFSIRLQRTPYLDEYWRPFLVDWHKPWILPWWLLRQTVKVFNHPYPPMGILLLALAVAGVLAFRSRQKGNLAALLLAPIALNLLAAAAGQYPYGGARVTIYLAVPIFILAAAGAFWLFNLPSMPPSRWRWLLPTLLLAPCMAMVLWHLVFPRIISNMRPVAAHVAQHYRPGDSIFAFDNSERVGRDYEFHCYWRGRSTVRSTWPADPSFLPTGRIWLAYTHNPVQDSGRLAPMLNQLQSEAKLIDEFHVPGGVAYLFERPPLADVSAD